jgi:hypothetical protein
MDAAFLAAAGSSGAAATLPAKTKSRSGAQSSPSTRIDEGMRPLAHDV